MDFGVQLGFDNINTQEGDDGAPKGYGVDHVVVAEGLGCVGLRVTDPDEIAPTLRRAQQLAAEHKVPVVVEVVLERVTNIAMGVEIDAITEFEELATVAEHAPTSLVPLAR
jgi:tartronate-semialdehyde synthase